MFGRMRVGAVCIWHGKASKVGHAGFSNDKNTRNGGGQQSKAVSVQCLRRRSTMAGTKNKPIPRSRRESREAEANGAIGEVLTLADAAAYLRLAEAEVLRLVRDQELP